MPGLRFFSGQQYLLPSKSDLGELDVLTILTIATFTSTIVLFIIVIAGKKFELL